MTDRIESSHIQKIYKMLGERDTLFLIGIRELDLDVLEAIHKGAMTIDEIARKFKISKPAAYERYQRAIANLAQSVIKASATYSVMNNYAKRAMALERENNMLRTEISLMKINQVPYGFVKGMPPESPKDILADHDKRKQLLATPIDEAGFSEVISNILRNAGIKNLDKLCSLTEYQVGSLPLLTQYRLLKIKKVLYKKGLKLNED